MNQNNFSTKQFVELALLVAVIVLLAFTPIGYIRTFGLEITLIVVPVTVGAVTLGPLSGAILGAVFGITSFIQCFGMSPFGAALLGINPFATFAVCVMPRVLMGWLTGLAYQRLKKSSPFQKIAVVIAQQTQPAAFPQALALFFYHTEFIQEIADSLGAKNVLGFAVAFVGINGVVEAAACFVVGSAISKALQAALKTN